MTLPDALVTGIASFAFIIFGSLAFNVAAALSGFSIYRELSTDHSRALTIAAGGFLFILSPLGYLLLYPLHFVEVKLVEPILYPAEHFVGLWFKPEFWGKLWSAPALLPFLCSVFGFGFVYGSMFRFGAREMILRNLRRLLRVNFTIYSYDLVWDDFLQSIKKKAPITVTTSTGEQIVGYIDSFSKDNEKEEICLRNIKFISDESTTASKQTESAEIPEQSSSQHEKRKMTKSARFEENGQGRLFLKGAEIRSIYVPDHLANRHWERKDHFEQGYYLMVTAVGLMLLSFSSFLTASFIHDTEFYAMLNFYFFWEVTFAFFAVGFLTIAAFFAAIEFHGKNKWRRLKCAAGLKRYYYRLITFIAVVLFIGSIFSWLLSVSWSDFSQMTDINWLVAGAKLVLLVALLTLLIVSSGKWRAYNDAKEKILKNFKAQCLDSASREGLDELSETLQKLYFCIDVNTPNHEWEKSISKLDSKLDPLKKLCCGPDAPFTHEHFNVIVEIFLDARRRLRKVEFYNGVASEKSRR